MILNIEKSNKGVSERLKKFVKVNLGLTQKEFRMILEEKAGQEISQGRCSMWYSGSPAPQWVLNILANDFHCNINWLLTGEGSEVNFKKKLKNIKVDPDKITNLKNILKDILDEMI